MSIDWTTAYAPGFSGVTLVLVEGIPRLYCDSGVEPDAVAVSSGALDALFHFPVGALTVTRPNGSTFDVVRPWLAEQTWTVRETTEPVDGTVSVEPVRFEFYDTTGAATELLSAPRARVARLLAADVDAVADIPLDSAVGVPSTGYGYIGRETVGWSALSTATLDVSGSGAGRGLFGSHARPHVAGEGTRRPTVTLGELPRYLTGRRVVVFLAELRGSTVYDPTPVSIGVVGAGVALSAGLMRWQIPADSLLTLLEHKLAKVSVRAFGWQHTDDALTVDFGNRLAIGPTDGLAGSLGWSADPQAFARIANLKGSALTQPINVGFVGGRFRITATGPGGDVTWQVAACWMTAYRNGTSPDLGENTEPTPECAMHLHGQFAVRRLGDWDQLPSTLAWTATVGGSTGRASAALVGDTDRTKRLFAQIVARDATTQTLTLQAMVEGLPPGIDTTQPGAVEVASRITKATDVTLGLVASGDHAPAALRALLAGADALQGTAAADALIDWEQIAATFSRVNLGHLPDARAYRVSGEDDSLLAPLVHECRLRGMALCIRSGRLGVYRPGYFSATEGVRRNIVEADVLAGMVPEVTDGLEPVVTAIRFTLPGGGSYTWRDTTAAEDFGEGKLVECKALESATGVLNPDTFANDIQRSAQQLLGVLSQPTRVVRIVVGPTFWNLNAGDLVTLTHSELPDLHGNRGLAACVAQVMEKRMAWGAGQCRVQLALLLSDDASLAGYAPSALVGGIAGAVVTIDTTSAWLDNCFAPDFDVNGAAITGQPLQGFAVGDKVQLSELNNESPMADEFFTISSMTTTTVTLSGSPSAPMVTAAATRYGCLLRFAPWTDAAVTTRQRGYLYVADATTEKLGGSSDPKRWAA